MKKLNFLGLIQHFLFSKSLSNKGSTESIHCDSVYSFGTHNTLREKMDNHNISQLSTDMCSSISGSGTAKKPPREEAVEATPSQALAVPVVNSEG